MPTSASSGPGEGRLVVAAALVVFCGCVATSSSPVLQGRAACAGDFCAPEPDDLRAGLVLFDHWKAEADKIRPYIQQVSNRSELFGPDIERLERLFGEMNKTREEGIARLRRRDFSGAWGRLNGLWLQLSVLTLQLNYLILVSHGEDAGVVTTHWMDILGDMSRRTTPLLDSLKGWDTEQISRAAAARRLDLAELQQNLPRIEDSFRRGARWTEKAVFVANGVTAALSAYEMAVALRGLPRGPDVTIRFPALAGASGAVASGGVVVISAEVLESIRELIRIGAISSSVVGANLALMTGKPELVSAGTAPATVGRTWPTRPPDKNAQPRGKPEKPGASDDAETIRGLKRQNEGARKLAQFGYDVEQLPGKASKVPGVRNPDFKIEGRIFDHYAPTSNRARNIWDRIRRDKIQPHGKTPPSTRIVLNLADSEVPLPALRKQFRDHSMQGLDEVILITRQGEILHLYP